MTAAAGALSKGDGMQCSGLVFVQCWRTTDFAEFLRIRNRHDSGAMARPYSLARDRDSVVWTVVLGGI
jgi:hypothetical protein